MKTKTIKPLPDRLKTFLEVMKLQEKGFGTFKFFGVYWEVIHPLFNKYQPELLKSYENLLNEEFEYFNPRVKEIIDTGDEEQNFKNAVNHYNREFQYKQTPDIDYVEDPDSGLDIAYMPNQSIDQNMHFGRGE